jgi:transcriptional regulator with XRE-family HTH domain
MVREKAQMKSMSDGVTDKDQVRHNFAARLEKARIKKKISQSELARQAAQYMPDNKFGRDLISGYVNARTLPTRVHLDALCSALGVPPEELLPEMSIQTEVPLRDVKPEGPNRVRIKIVQAVTYDQMARIFTILDEGQR